jgi:hypothetical protein
MLVVSANVKAVRVEELCKAVVGHTVRMALRCSQQERVNDVDTRIFRVGASLRSQLTADSVSMVGMSAQQSNTRSGSTPSSLATHFHS